MPKSSSDAELVKIRVSFKGYDGEDHRQRVRMPAFYARNLARTNIGCEVSPVEIRLYKGWMIATDEIAGTWWLASTNPIPPELCAQLRRWGLHREANQLAGRVQAKTLDRYSTVFVFDPARYQDRYFLRSGTLA